MIVVSLILAIAGLVCQAQVPIPLVYWSSVQYSCNIAASGPSAWTVTVGTLPDGVNLDAITGLVVPASDGPGTAAPNPPMSVTIEIAGEPTLALEPSSETKETGLGVQHLELDGSTISDSFC